MKFIAGFLVIIAISGFQIIQGQSNRNIVPGKLHKITGSSYLVKIPDDFEISKSHKDEFVFKEKGSVVKFVHLKDISATMFCDSMTTQYFEAQGLHEVTETKIGDIINFKGKFTINQVPYIRSFYIIPHKGNTILGISNYPEKLEGELEYHFLNMHKNNKNE